MVYVYVCCNIAQVRHTCLTLQSCMGAQDSSQAGMAGTLRSCCRTCASYPDLNSTTSCKKEIPILNTELVHRIEHQSSAALKVARAATLE